MTVYQASVIRAARLTAQQTLATFEKQCGLKIPAPYDQILTAAILAAQIGMAREVAQFDANQRAEIARFGDAEVLAAVKDIQP